ncbi:hypothetical protein RvY_16885 [Ramazzottius varieornatus]|uniref:beta-glucosidase n=1 Tax=Ramazzottius varieornatus TaxID=947166 RepID=A0A1D1W2M3_RAMVA|nr:hypothetical protein RvY_16885 [Ramazzottius varieornatus]
METICSAGIGSKALQMEDEITALMDDMTLEEKLGQLQLLASSHYHDLPPSEQLLELARQGLLGAVLNTRGAANTNALQKAALSSRQKIPLLVGLDVLHGYRTSFPIPLAQAASWDVEAVEKVAAIAAAEARASGINWNFAPLVDICRDPRWGRVMEGSGEDVHLACQMAKARVRGFQGTDYSQADKVMACAKHFAGYGADKGGRDYNSVDMSERQLREVCFPPFQAAIEAGVGSLMAAYMELNGVPASGNHWLLQQVLRDEWAFDGLVVSDFKAVSDMTNQQFSADDAQAAMYALNAGMNMEMQSTTFADHAPQLLQEGKVKMEVIDKAVRHVLRAKFRLGLFEKPLTDEKLASSVVLSPSSLQFAREMASRTLVLLKNDNGLLPLSKSIKRLAVIGELAYDQQQTLDFWALNARAQDSVTIYSGIVEKCPSTAVKYAAGYEMFGESTERFTEALQLATSSDMVVLVVGEPKEYSGETNCRTDIGLPGRQLELVKGIAASGTPYIIVLMTGRPLALEWLASHAPAILLTWRAGTMGGAAIADVLFGDVNPSGKLPITFPRCVGQIPIHYDVKQPGKPQIKGQKMQFNYSRYIDCPNEPLYPFGFGLSYTTFHFDNLTVTPKEIEGDGQVKIGVEVRNTGLKEGEEVVQVYVRDVAASVARPVRQLKAFHKVRLGLAEEKRLEFTLGSNELGFLNREWKWTVEAGKFEVFVGNNSDADLSDSFLVTSTYTKNSNAQAVKH